MKKAVKIIGLSMVFVSLLFGAYMIGVEKGGTSILATNATPQTFNTVLATSLMRLAQCDQKCELGRIIINVNGDEVIVEVKMKDLDKLTRTQITYDQFVRSYLKFS
jgi:hypothetical protein